MSDRRAARYRARREARLDLHAARGPILPWDVALTIGLLVVATIVLPFVTTLSALVAIVSDGCRSDACVAAVSTAVWVGLLLPILTVLTGITVCILRLVRHQRGWPVAVWIIVFTLLCLPLAWGVAIVGAAIWP